MNKREITDPSLVQKGVTGTSMLLTSVKVKTILMESMNPDQMLIQAGEVLRQVQIEMLNRRDFVAHLLQPTSRIRRILRKVLWTNLKSSSHLI